MFKQRSISSLIFGCIACVLLMGIVIMGTAQMVLTMRYFREERRQLLVNIVAIGVDQVNEVLQREDTPNRVDELEIGMDTAVKISEREQLIGLSSSTILSVADTNGRILLCSDENILSAPNAVIGTDERLRMQAEGVQFGQGTMGGAWVENCFSAGTAFWTRDGQVAGYLIASSSSQDMYVYLWDVFSTFVLSSGVMLLMASVVSIALTDRLTLPLRHIAMAAKRFGSGDFSARAPKEESCVEVEQLTDSFNNMARNLEAQDSSRSQFIGNIAHELRTPMTSIKGFVDGMLDGTIPPELQGHYLELVSEESGRLSRLIQNMLDITKLEAGEYKVNAAAFDVWSAITGVLFAQEKRIDENKIKIEGLTLDPVMVYADRDLVYQVVSNLVDNALKFTPQGGTLCFGVQKGGGMATVSIWNSGQGISKDALPFIFDRFYKEDKSRGMNKKGSGLGLHICKVLINLSGGSIRAESEEGKWCCFYFTLPLPAEKGMRLPLPGKRPASGETKN